MLRNSGRLGQSIQPSPPMDAIASEMHVPGRPVTTVVSIQYLRALAASLVVFHHAMAVSSLAAYYPRPFGLVGVDLFFVISGYIMWRTTADGNRRPLAFWSARLVRIVPIYWIFTTLYILVAIFLPSAVFNAALDPMHIVKSYLFIPAANPRTGDISPVYTLGWTLNYEIFFYFVFGCCLFIQPTVARFGAIIGSLGLLVLIGASVSVHGAIATVYTDPILLEFAAGIVLAQVSSHLARFTAPLGWALIGAAIVWLVVIYGGGAIPGRIVAHGIPAAALVAGGLILETKARVRPSRLGLLLGDASYSIYLAHPFALRVWYFAFVALGGMASLTSGAIFIATAMAIGIAGGVASFLFLERPLLVAGRHWIRQRTKRPGA